MNESIYVKEFYRDIPAALEKAFKYNDQIESWLFDDTDTNCKIVLKEPNTAAEFAHFINSYWNHIFDQRFTSLILMCDKQTITLHFTNDTDNIIYIKIEEL